MVTNSTPAIAPDTPQPAVEAETREGKSLREVQIAERDLYLGKTDVVPFSGGKTVPEVRAEHEAQQIAQEAAVAAKRPKKEDGEPVGTMPLRADITEATDAPAVKAEDADAATDADDKTDLPELPSFDELTAMDHPTILAQADKEGLEDPELADLPNPDIVDLILSKRAV